MNAPIAIRPKLAETVVASDVKRGPHRRTVL